jgi:cation-transporting ATPase E
MDVVGLSAADAEARRAEGLGNEVAAGSSRPLRVIIRANVLTRFNAILAVLLAVIIVVGPFQDGLFALVLVLNTLIGIIQELRAKRTLDRLAVVNAPKVRVWRDGAVEPLDGSELVIDDVVELGRGDQLAVDGVVVSGNLELDESLLTGESDPVTRGAGAVVHSGSFVSAGSGRYRVTAVGDASFAQQMVGEARRFALARSELVDGVNLFLQYIQWLLIPVSALLIVSQLISNSDLADAIRGCVAGVAAMIPEGLVLLTSVAFAVAVVRLGRRNVLVQELAAVEGLARVDVVCVDKTGTLTEGRIEPSELVVLDPTAAVEAALGALAAAEPNPNPTQAAIASRWAPAAGWEAGRVAPFSSARRWSGADFGDHGRWVLGAPDALGFGSEARVGGVLATAAARGHRVVLLARAGGLWPEEGPPIGLEPVAVVTLAETVRPEAAETLAYFASQGVAVKVVSGDHPDTVASIAAAVGVPGADRPVDAGSLRDEELFDLAEEATVFGRVAPRQKQVLVAALQSRGHTVAMTGDGVNDVLALKDADVGVAMGSGSAATRAVAQVVLLDDRLSSLPPVIGEGRRVIANVERAANLFITKTAYATLIAVGVAVTGVAYPLLPRHLTIVDDFSIGIPGFVLALLPNARPFRRGYVGRVLRFSVPCGLVAGAACLTAYWLADAAVSLEEARTVATVVLVALGLWVLTLVARPLTTVRAVLVVAMIGSFAGMLALPGLRHYFALRLPPGGQLLEAGAAVAVGGVLLEVIRWMVGTTAGLNSDAAGTRP